ncbi:MAG: hypothetical protein ACYC63_03670 [Armatimonadota bacterium]
MQAGFAKADINSTPSALMFGFAGRDVEKPIEGVHDDLFVRALYLREGEEQALILAYDLLFLGEAEVEQFRAALADRLVGLEPSQMMFNTSHSHVTPRIGTWAWGGHTPPDAAYVGKVLAATLEAAEAARDAACEVTLHAGKTKTAIPLSRRKIDEQGRAQWAPNLGGRVCDTLPYCLLKDANGQPVCLLFSISCHPSMIAGWETSAEYPGAACRALDAHLDCECSMFLQGTGGDAKPALSGSTGQWRSCTWEEVEQVGRQAADEVIRGLSSDLTQIKPALRCELEVLHWPLQPALDEDGFLAIADDATQTEQKRIWAKRNAETLQRGETLPRSFSVAIQGLQLGEGLRLVAMQGEAVAGWGRLILKHYPQGVTFPLAYANGQGLYLPTSDIIPEGGYEVESYHEYWVPSALAPGFEEIFLSALKRFGLR